MYLNKMLDQCLDAKLTQMSGTMCKIIDAGRSGYFNLYDIVPIVIKSRVVSPFLGKDKQLSPMKELFWR